MALTQKTYVQYGFLLNMPTLCTNGCYRSPDTNDRLGDGDSFMKALWCFNSVQ